MKLIIFLKTKFISFFKSIKLSRFISYLLILIFSFLLFLYGSKIKYVTNEGYQELNNNIFSIEYTKIKVIDTVDKWTVYDINPETQEKTDVIKEQWYIYKGKILDGEKKGEYTYIVHTTYGLEVHTIHEVTKGSNIYGRNYKFNSNDFINNPDCEYSNVITHFLAASPFSFDHVPTLLFLIGTFVFLLLCFSRIKGFHTLLSLVLACASIIFVYIPAVLSGQNIYFWTIFICLYSIVETLILLEGFTKKTLAACVGCLCGVLISCIICVITNNTMNIIGSSEDIGDAQFTISHTYWETFGRLRTLDLRGLIFSAVAFGALGAIMDVAMSLASSLLEVYENSENHSVRQTIKSGFNIGKDMLGTMSNTLILAYLSTSLCSTLYYVSHYYVEAILRKEFFALALAQSFIGCIGILITIPLTSVICAFLYNKKEEWFPTKDKSIKE